MRTFAVFTACALLFASITSGQAQQPDAWEDASPHTRRFISVDPNVQLEVLREMRAFLARRVSGR